MKYHAYLHEVLCNRIELKSHFVVEGERWTILKKQFDAHGEYMVASAFALPRASSDLEKQQSMKTAMREGLHLSWNVNCKPNSLTVFRA